ncbi:MAG: phosphotransferase family protein, partial [Actinomycetes bacterium]
MDASAATWLAGLDPALTLLPQALPRPSPGIRWELHDVRWTPGQGCRLAYRVQAAGSPSTFVALEVTATEWSRHDYREDPRLPGLASASDPTVLPGLLAQAFDLPIRGCRVEPVRYRPGSRCVLRYEVETTAWTSRLYAKVFRPERFAEISSLGTVLAHPRTGTRLVPELTAVWPDLQVMVGKEINGRVLSAVVGDAGVPPGQRARLAHRLGDLLARFHQQSDIAAPHWSTDEQVDALAIAAAPVRFADARLADRLDAVLELLMARVPAAATEVLGHGGFRAGQVVLSDDDQLVVLDTDRVCRCDPGRDLGTALAHLTWQGVRQPGQRTTLRGAEHALLAGYQDHA